MNSAAKTPRLGLGGRSFRALMAAQFLGAFNDNALRMIVALLIVTGMGRKGVEQVPLLAGVLAVFALPFILFSTFAGSLADRFSKRTVLVWSKAAEIPATLLAALAFWSGSSWVYLVTVFLMGAQSAFFGPAKYGVLPEILDESELSRGNGLVELFTELAIILGGAAGGLLLGAFRDSHLFVAGLILAGIAVLGTLAVVWIEPLPAARPGARFRLNFAAEAWENLRAVRGDRALHLCVLGVSYFWLMGALFQLNFYVYGYSLLKLQDWQLGLLLSLAGVGIGLGSLLAGRLSGGKVEWGLVPIGAAGMALFSLALFFTSGSTPLTSVVLFLLGAATGFYLVPLVSFVQQRAPRDGKGAVVALSNLLSFVAIVLAAGLFALVGAKLNPAQTYLFLALLTVGVAAYIFTLLPDFLLRFALWSFTRALYRVRAVGEENVPRKGGALLVCNHVSYMDALLVLSCLQRFVRFIMYRRFYEWPLISWGCRQLKVIPISESDGPRAMVRSLRGAAELIRQGELVCIFAEGSITRTGNLLRFQRGFTRVMKNQAAPIIPVHIDRMWGSIFSFEGGRAFARLPRLERSKVTVSFGRPLPTDSSAAAVRQAVCDLGAEAFALRKSDQVLLHESFIASARSAPGRMCVADTGGTALSYRRALWAATALARELRARLAGDGNEMVGVLLPASAGGALANVALLMCGRVPVNLNWTAGPAALRSAVAQCGIRTVVTAAEFTKRVSLGELGIAPGSGTPRFLYLDELRARLSFGRRLVALLAAELLPARLLLRLCGARRRGVDELCTVIFSSGSTGEPKGVMLSHSNVMSDVEGMSQVFAAGGSDRLAGVLPLFHSFGFTATLWLPLVKRLGVVYHPNPLEGRAVGAMVREFRATLLLATPTFLRLYTRAVLPGDFGSLRQVVVGAEKLRDDVASAFFEKFGIHPAEGYGCTECSPVVSINVPDFRSPGVMQKGTKRGTIGQPIPGVTVRVVDPEGLAPLPVGESGLLLVRGANVMRGYLNRPELTAEVIRDGWYVTGDIARVDEDGFITITDRLSRFSKIGGEMVPHGRVEEEIERLLEPAAEPMVAVTGVGDPKKGERLVVLHRHMDLPVEEILEHLSAAGLPKLFIPRREDFHEVERIPVLGSGKVDLRAVKQLAAALDSPPPAPSAADGDEHEDFTAEAEAG